jgi:hypothetical protein
MAPRSIPILMAIRNLIGTKAAQAEPNTRSMSVPACRWVPEKMLRLALFSPVDDQAQESCELAAASKDPVNNGDRFSKGPCRENGLA